jgi:CheY-like chemotaxis protein
LKAVTTPISIFVAEDDFDDVTFFREAIKKIGLPINLAFFVNGRQLIESLRHRRPPPNLIFLDINMPEMNGLQACKAICSDPDFSQVPLFILTTSANEYEREFCLDHGAKSFLTKPISIVELSNMLKQLIDKWVVSSHPSCTYTIDTPRNSVRLSCATSRE